MGFCGKESAASAGDAGLIPGSRSPGGRCGHPLQHSCLGNPMDRGAWRDYSTWGCKRAGHDLATEHTHAPDIIISGPKTEKGPKTHNLGLSIKKIRQS